VSSGDGVTVGIDIGTTSVKAVVVDPDGSVVARARIRHPLVSGSAEQLQHDAARAWRQGPRRALAALGDVRAKALSVTGMVPSLAAVRRSGVPLSQGLLYGDRTGRPDAAAEPALLRGDAGAFLRVLAQAHPGAHGYWPAQTTALAALGGPPVVAAMVSFVLGPLAVGGAWNSELLAECGVTEAQLPRIVPDRTPVGRAGDMLLDPGGIDVMCERIVAGATREGDVLVLCGSTLIVILLVAADHVVPPGVPAFPHASGGQVVTTASNAGGLFLDWVDRVIAPAKGDVEPDRVPVWSPYIRGERTPWEDADRRGQLVDLHLGHDAAAIRRAAHEASGFVVRHHLDLTGVAARRIVAVGGGTTSAAWMQALADCTGLPVDVQAVPDGAAIGAAFLARMSAGLEDDINAAGRWARVGRTVEPRPEWAAAVEGRYARFRQLADVSPAPRG
jgi:xylulokinase